MPRRAVSSRSATRTSWLASPCSPIPEPPPTRPGPGTLASRHMSVFARTPIAELAAADDPNSLKRVLGAGDLIMLAIGAVIGAGIFGAIGTAAAGQTGPDGEVIRYGAGPGL